MMGFNTISFWLIFTCLFFIYQLISKRVFQNAFLLFFSYCFYASYSPHFLFLIIFSTLVDFFVGFWAGPVNPMWKRRLALSLSIFVNLGLLFTFKSLIEISNHNELRELLGSAFSHLLLDIGPPIGISFYTFQTLSYTFDVYRGKIKATHDLQDFALYVSFFPQLLAGPIEKARRLLPQFQKDRQVSWRDYQEGIVLILFGLFKKVYVADSIAVAIDFVFEQKDTESNLIIFASILMTFRVYADFSGYSDIARGLARFFGIQLIQNFKPFFMCSSPAAFWRTWHISFMEWVRDYLILPLRNFRKTEFLISLRILLALSVVGIWHKISWNWLVFGLMHGLALLLYRWWNLSQRKYHIKLPSWFKKSFGFLFMIHLYFFSGLLHRSSDLKTAFSMLQSIPLSDFWNYGIVNYLIYIFQFIGPLIFYEVMTLIKKDEFFILKYHWLFRAFMMALALSFLILFERTSESGFVYFAF